MERRIMGWQEFSVTEATKSDKRDARVSRRDFLTGLGTTAVATGLAITGAKRAYDLISRDSPEDTKDREDNEDATSWIPRLGSPFTYPDPSTAEGYDTYRAICDEFIKTRKPNLLGITGDMLADGARKAHAKTGIIHPPELALAQLVWEGGIGNSDPNSRPNKTNNPFNLGNDDMGNDRHFETPKKGVDLYFMVMAKDYLRVRTPEQLMQKGGFVNFEGLRYASATNYEKELKATARSIKRKISNKLTREKK
jgi:hypothetical protein